MNAVEDYITELQTINNVSTEYTRAIKTALRDFVRAHGGTAEEGHDMAYDMPVCTNEEDIKKWIAAMRRRTVRGRPLNNNTVKKNVAFVRGFYNFLIESPNHDCTYNPCNRMYKKLPSGVKQTKRPYKTVAEVAEFIRSITHPRDRCIITMMAKNGMRRGEICGLDLDDADLETDILHIRQHLDDATGELLPGRKNGEMTDLPIDDELHRLLQVYITLRPRSNTPALFLSRTGLRICGRDIGERLHGWVKKHWGSNGKATSEKITPHWFRAFLTYELSMGGCNPVVIAVIRGDRAARMQDFYTRQVLGFEKIREEYLKAAPRLGL